MSPHYSPPNKVHHGGVSYYSFLVDFVVDFNLMDTIYCVLGSNCAFRNDDNEYDKIKRIE